MQKITPCLWFDGQAQEAAEHYVAIFGGGISRILDTTYYSEAGPGETGSVLTVDFRLAGQDYMGLNGGPQFPFTEAISLSVDCADQAEVDRFWDALSEGGETGQCGWLGAASASPGRSRRTSCRSCWPTRTGRRRTARCGGPGHGHEFDVQALGR
ncbi:hypothetical protein SCALM49S_04302 [Streptomyces californicus]